MRNIKIRLPDEDDSPTEGSCCGFAYKEGWNACIGEVTRLNAVPDRDELFAQTVNLIRPMTGGGLMIVSEPHGTRYVPESLLLDARAEVERLQASLDLLHGVRFSDRCYNALKSRAERAEALAASNQAKIDALMLEYCPDEMTPEQRAEWARHQKPDTAIDAVGGRVETQTTGDENEQ